MFYRIIARKTTAYGAAELGRTAISLRELVAELYGLLRAGYRPTGITVRRYNGPPDIYARYADRLPACQPIPRGMRWAFALLPRSAINYWPVSTPEGIRMVDSLPDMRTREYRHAFGRRYCWRDGPLCP